MTKDNHDKHDTDFQKNKLKERVLDNRIEFANKIENWKPIDQNGRNTDIKKNH